MTQREAMPQQSQLLAEEVAQRGEAIYEHDVQPHLKVEDEGKFVVIDVNTGTYEIDTNDIVALNRLLARQPHALLWLRRVGSRPAYRFGPRQRVAE